MTMEPTIDAGNGTSTGQAQTAQTLAGASGGNSILSVSGGQAAATPAAGATGQAGAVTAQSPQVTFPENWKDGLGDEFKADPTLSKYQTIPELAKAHVNLQKLVGKDKIHIPDKLATADDWKGVFQKLGLPEKPESYEFAVPKDAFQDGFVKDFKEVAFKNNILPKQAEGLLGWYAGLQKQAAEQRNTEIANQYHQASEALKREWGEAYDKKIQAGSTAARRFFDERGLSFLDQSGLASNIHMVKAFAAIGDILKEHGIKGSPATSTGVTPADALQRIAEIRSNPDHPYNKPAHPNKKAAVEEMERLYKSAYPET